METAQQIPKADKLEINFSAPQMSVLTSTAPRNLFFSGQGGGKTFLEGVISALLVKSAPKAVGMICANTYGQLSASTMKEIKKVWAKFFGLTEYTKQNPTGNFVSNRYPPAEWSWEGKFHERLDDSYGTICFKNGALLYKASLDNYKAIDGRNLSWCLLDETKDTKEEAVKMVILGRLRQAGLYVRNDYKTRLKRFFAGGAKLDSLADLLPFTTDATTGGKPNESINPLYMFTTPYKQLWLVNFFKLKDSINEIKKSIFSKTDYFVQQRGNKKVVIASNYHNQQNLPKNFIKNLIEDLSDELIDLKVYAYPFAKSGKEYAKSFDRKTHVGRVAVLPAAMVHYTVDFNVNPYMTGLVIQLEYVRNSPQTWNGFSTYVICRICREHALKYPRNEAFYLGEALTTEFGALLGHGFYLYGDASGQNRLGTKDTKTLFSDVLRGLGNDRHFSNLRIPRSNPRYKNIGKGMLGRKSFLNVLLSGKKPVRIIIDESCTELIDDLEFCEEDINGKLDKKKTKGVELRGHHLDALQYFLCHEKTFASLAIVRTK